MIGEVVITQGRWGQKYSCPFCGFTPSGLEVKCKGWGKSQRLRKIVREHMKTCKEKQNKRKEEIMSRGLWVDFLLVTTEDGIIFPTWTHKKFNHERQFDFFYFDLTKFVLHLI